jgi:putative ATP-binding cassette transporter
MKLVRFYLRQYRWMVILSALVGVLAGISSAMLMMVVGLRLARPDSPAAILGLAFVGLALIDLLAGLGSGIVSIYLQQKINMGMSLTLCRQMLSAPLRQIEDAGLHRVLAALGSDMANITGAFLKVPSLCINLAILISCLAYLAWLSMSMFLALLLFLALAVTSYVIPETKAKHLLKLAREHWDVVFNYYRSMTEGAKELKLHRRRRQAFYYDGLHASTVTLRRHSLKAGKIYVSLGVWSNMLYFIVIGLIIFALPLFLKDVDNSVLIGYALTALYMRGPLSALVSSVPSFAGANVSLERFEKLGLSLTCIDISEDTMNKPDPKPIWSSIEVDGITHSYYREKEDASFVLGPIFMTLYPGEIVFIVGGNGSGKTTLAKLLTGLYPPEGGEIRINGEVINDSNRDDYRQFFTAVFADFYLFDKLLGLYGSNLNERAQHYIAKLQLDHKVKVVDGKLSTVDLSFGQRKRLALLTAYLEDRPIYVFDEWAAGQDPAFKEVFYSELLPELKSMGKTVIVVTHDDRYFHLADRIVKLDFGQIVSDQPVVHSEEAGLAYSSV